MSQPAIAGREIRQSLNSKPGGNESSEITVKTLPNSKRQKETSRALDAKYGSSNKYDSRTKILQKSEKVSTAVDSNPKDKVLTDGEGFASNNASGNSASNHSGPRSASTASSKSNGERKLVKSFDDRSQNVVEVRSQVNPRDYKRSSKGARSRPHNDGSGGAYRGSGRVFTASEKVRVASKKNHHITENFKLTINDATLCNMLVSIADNGGKDPLGQTSELLTYMNSLENMRNIQKEGQSIWDALLLLTTLYNSQNGVTQNLILCLAKCGELHFKTSSGAYNGTFLDWLMDMYESGDEDTKVTVMLSTYELMRFGSVPFTEDQLHKLLEELFGLLEGVCSSRVFLAILKCMLCYSKRYSDLFQPVLTEVVDIIFGWFVDLDSSDDTVSIVTEAVMSLRDLWMMHIEYCHIMTSNFIEDADYEIKKVLSPTEDILPNVDRVVQKVVLYFRAFHTLVRASDCFNGNKYPDLEKFHVTKCAEQILICFNQITYELRVKHEALQVTVDECLSVLLPCGEDLSYSEIFVEYLLTRVKEIHTGTYMEQLAFMSMLSKTVKLCDAHRLAGVYESFNATDLSSLKLNGNSGVMRSILHVYHNLFTLKDMNVIQTMYRHMKESIEFSLRVLSGDTGVKWSDSRAHVSRVTEAASEMLVFNLLALTQVATDNNNLILMYALEPTVFNLLLKEILLDYGEHIKQFPNLLVCVLRLLLLHCSSNKHFITKSNLCAVDSTRPKLLNITVHKTSGDNFSMILEFLPYVLSLTVGIPKALILMSEWFNDIVQQVFVLNQPLLKNNLLVNAAKHMLQLEDGEYVESALINISSSLMTLLKSQYLSDSLLDIIQDFCLHQLSSELVSIQRSYLQTLCQLPTKSLVRLKAEESAKRYNQVLSARRSIMSGSFGSLGPENFRVIANILFKQYADKSDIDTHQLQRLLMTSNEPALPVDQIIHHNGLLEYWSLWQSADFCVAHKLRTPIGKPVDTFMCIEAVIKQIAADKRNEVPTKSAADSKRVWLLLQFMENLEKVLYNAYEGVAGNMSSHNKQMIKSFFRTNKATCVEWLTRIRLHILSIASAFNHPSTVVRHGYELLNDMVKNQSTQTPEFELVLVYLTDAWCHLNCAEAIQGLYDWCKNVCNRKLPWIKSVIPKAMQRFEDGIGELKLSLENTINPKAQVSASEHIQLHTRPQQPIVAVTQFCVQQITNCYTSLQSWQEASDWLKEFNSLKTAHASLVDIDPVNGCDKVLLRDWLQNKSCDIMSWSKEQHLTALWTQSFNQSREIVKLATEDRSRLEKFVQLESTSDWPACIDPDAMLMLLCGRLVEQGSMLEIPTSLDGVNLSWLLKLKQVVESPSYTSDQSKQHALVITCREARLTNNLKLADRVISSLCAKPPSDLMSSLDVKIIREKSKLLYRRDQKELALANMVNIVGKTAISGQDTADIVARSTLTIAKWLQSDTRYQTELKDEQSLNQIAGLHEVVNRSQRFYTESSTVPYFEQMIGSLLSLSTNQCSSLAKTWHMYGNWAYKWGRKCLDNASQMLNDDEVMQIESLLSGDLSRQEKDDVITVMRSIQGTFSPVDEDFTEESPDYETDDLIEIRNRLNACCPRLSDETLDGLVQLWMTMAKRVYHLYEESAKSYFCYLNLSSTNQSSDYQNVTVTLRLLRLLVKHAWELRAVLEKGLKDTPTGPWRSIIPQLFSRLNHPEQYVRLSVSELLMRLAEDFPHLIIYPAIVGCKQASQSTNKALSYMQTDDSDNEAETSPDKAEQSESNSSLVDCFKDLVNTLSSKNPDLIIQVDTFVTELCRITVLWDELWLGSLSQLCVSAIERISSLESEVERVRNNPSLSPPERLLLIKQKRETIVKPLTHAIERLTEITIQTTAETKHEIDFQETYSSLILKGLEALRNPAKDEDLQNDWQPFKQLYLALQRRSQKRPSHMLKMKDISAKLSSLSDTYIPLPGIIARSDRQPVTLKSVLPTVQILPTKTKPKKLAFLGSDGQKYMYLFKGLEDLHLDERIMQLLNIVNDMLDCKLSENSEIPKYRARNYSVTPLGLRSGLIQWVDGCVPLFSLYKRWQVREAAVQQAKSNSANTGLRPSEVFYSKLIPQLKQSFDDKSLKDIKEVEKIRKDWPLNILINVTKQLIADTPSYLVAREIWCSSTSANEWWTMTQTYSRSVAVMSAIGYILGLGDRHLDNLLLDVNNAEVVHIDYNVCFDKGKSLRVPERVPFRLTQNLVAAMGATGIEGIFRSACEHTVKSMRLGKEALLTLLEAFVYDPLVDWTVGGETGLAGAFFGGNYAFGSAAKDHRRRKKQMEREITRSMFSIRVTEMKSAWLQNKEDMTSSLNEIVTKLATIADETQKIDSYSQQIVQCEHLLLDIEEMKADGGQAVTQLMQRYDAHMAHLSVKDEYLKELKALIEELSKYDRLHQASINGLSSSLEKLADGFKAIPALGTSPCACARSFLQSVGQVSHLDQVDHLNEQLKLGFERRQLLTAQCFDLLKAYASVVGQFSPSFYTSNHIMADCLKLMKKLMEDFSLLNCEALTNELLHNPRLFPSASLRTKISATQVSIESSINSDIAKITKVVERYSMESSDLEELNKQYQARSKAIASFIQNEDFGYYSLMYAVLPKIVEVSRRYLVMEGASSRAGDRLHALTSRDGDWFLDELTCVTENLLEYINMTRLDEAVDIVDDEENTAERNGCSHLHYDIMKNVYKVYESLQDMMHNFTLVILPDVVNGLYKSDPSMLSVISDLEEILQKSADLKDLNSRLEAALRNIIFGTNDPDKGLLQSIKHLRMEYKLLLAAPNSSYSDNNSRSNGLMSIMALDGLFAHTFEQYEEAMVAFAMLPMPKNWKKVDIIREAGAYQQTQYNDRTRPLISDLLFLKQLKVMSDFYNSAREYVAAITDIDKGSVESYDSLSQPIKVFVAEFVRKNLLGVASQTVGYFICDLLSQTGLQVEKEIELKDFGANSRVSIEDLCRKGLEMLSSIEGLTSQAHTLASNFDQSWRRLDLATRLRRRQEQLRSLVAQQQLRLTNYLWLHEEYLPNPPNNLQPHGHNRKAILSDIHRGLTALMSTDIPFSELYEKLLALESSIAQRLKWASGANPQLHSVMSTFEQAQATRSTALQTEGWIVKELSTYCNSVLHLESMRTNSNEAIQIVSKTKDILERCTEICKTLEAGDKITEEQMLMVSLMNLADRQKTGNAFLGRAHDACKSHIASLTSKIRGLKKSTGQLKEKYQSHVTSIQYKTLNSHHKLISEVRAVLKTLAKEEMDEPSLGTPIQDYLNDYKSFSENLTSLLRTAMAENITPAVNAVINELVAIVLKDVDNIFLRLVEISKPLTSIPEESACQKQSSADAKSPNHIRGIGREASEMSFSMLGKEKVSADKVLRDPKTGKAVQERNSYAVSVWKRVKMKLDGRELDPNKKMTVADQVGYIISEATDIKNLAQMYEGWTSWV